MIFIKCDRCGLENLLDDWKAAVKSIPENWHTIDKRHVCDKCMSKFRAYFMRDELEDSNKYTEVLEGIVGFREQLDTIDPNSTDYLSCSCALDSEINKAKLLLKKD